MDPRPPRFAHIISAILAHPWAIDRGSEAWGAMCDILAMRAAGDRLDPSEITAAIEVAAASNGARGGGGRAGTVAVIPIYGVISPRVSSTSRMSGGTNAETISREFDAALRDAEVDGIVLDVDSPGGNVMGIDELAAQIRDARGTKPISAVANHSALSAAYYIASAADEVVVSASGRVGSIGVIAAHQDISAAQEKLGVRTTVITAGKFKGEGNEFAPLSDEARAAFQADADTYYGMFVRAVAKGRGVPTDQVRAGFGEGRSVLARAALDQGMADRIDTLDNTIRRVARGAVTARPVAAPSALETAAYRVVVPVTAGEVSDPVDDQATDDDEATTPSTERVVPARQTQLRLREAALEAGLVLG